MTTRKFSLEERRARLARRHHLAPELGSDDVVEVAADLVGLHSTDPATVFLAARARMHHLSVADVERALYDERSLVRMLGMRRTMFVVPAGLAPVVQGACARAIAAKQRRLVESLLERAGVATAAGPWLRAVEDATEAALAARGEATGTELAKDVPQLRERIHVAEGKPYGSIVNVTTQVLFLLAAEGRIVRGRPRGSWLSSQYRWSPAAAWLPGGIPELAVDEARARLIREWLRAYGPGAAADIRWWTGLTAGEVRGALAVIGPAEVELHDGSPGFALADDLEAVAVPEPWVGLLPALDPTVMGWSGREWYLGSHGPALFDRSGNPSPTVWCDGRIVGGWAQRTNGEIGVRLLEDVGRESTASIEAEAERLGAWLGDVRLTPRTRLPSVVERELLA
jgi:DNA glycosylase AlkZ-like